MNDDNLIRIIKAHRKDSYGPYDSELVQERAEAMDRYHGRPYGDEQPGRSQVVTKDLAETVDWIMPSVMRVLLQSGALAEFDPVGEEDEELAEQQTDYINHVIMKDNPGFIILHDAIKDGLILKNLYAKHWWDDSEITREREYTNIDDMELAYILQNIQSRGVEVEVIDHDVNADGTHNLKIKTKKKVNRVKLAAIPPEEINVSKRCRGSLQDSPFVEWATVKTRSELIEMGMPKDWVNGLNRSGFLEDTREKEARNDDNDQQHSESIDKSIDDINYCEVFVRADYDGDGIAELRKVILADDKIPPGDEWNTPVETVEFTGGVVKRVPHRHAGESINDDLEDLARIKTTLTRQMLDNVYHTNNTQWLVNQRVNLEDFLMSLPGGVKRVNDKEPVNGAAEPVQTTPILNQLLPVIDYIEGTKEVRTGISKATTGLDPDVLQQTTKGAFLENLSRASQKVEMITRMIAETFVKELVLRVHELVIKHQDEERVVKIRGRYIPVNPREWEERTDLTVKVGLGTGNNEDKLQKLSMLLEAQEAKKSSGLVGPEQEYGLFVDIAKAVGADTPDKYIINPASEEFQQNRMYLMGLAQQAQGGNPLAEAEHIKAQAQMQIKAAEYQLKQQEQQSRALLEQQRQEFESRLKEQDIALRQQEIALRAREVDTKERTEVARLENDRYKTELQFSASVAIEQLKQGASLEKALSVAIPEMARQNDEVITSVLNSLLTHMSSAQASGNTQLQTAFNGLNDQLSEFVTRMGQPRRVVYDDDGNPVGIEIET